MDPIDPCGILVFHPKPGGPMHPITIFMIMIIIMIALLRFTTY